MGKGILKIAGAVAVAGSLFVFSTAYGSEHTEAETLITRSAVPVEEGHFDIEVGMAYHKADAGKRGQWNNRWSRSRRFGSDSFRMYEWNVKATMGIAPDLHVAFETGYVDMYDRAMGGLEGMSNHGRGMDDLSISLKGRFLEYRGLSLAYIPGLTIPTGRHTNFGRQRFGPGRNYWTLDQTLAMTQKMDEAVFNADVGYSLPFGRTRRGYEREFGVHTAWHDAENPKDPGERGVLRGNAGLVYAGDLLAFTAVDFRPLAELNYAHRWISRGNDSDLLHATAGVIASVDGGPRVKFGYQHPVAGRNAARTNRVHLSLAYDF